MGLMSQLDRRMCCGSRYRPGGLITMDSQKIVFFVPNLTPRPNRRIKEFLDAGFDCEVFCMSHSEDIVYPCYKVTYLNEERLYDLSYPKRMLLFSRQIGDVVRKYDKKRTLFYFFSFNTAFYVLLRNLRFVYEESDMLFDRFSSPILRHLTIRLNRRIIAKSRITVFTSEGFANYYYKHLIPANIIIAPNKVDKKCLDLPVVHKQDTDFNHLRFGFAGYLRYETLKRFADVLIKNFPTARFDFFGRNNDFSEEVISDLKKTGRVFFHGPFMSPDDLPKIYSQLDFIVATYDVRGINPRYLEPNKLYEAIFFRTPIIVSRESFLEDKVKELGIGFSVNALDDKDIISEVGKITPDDYKGYISKLESIARESVITSNEELIRRVLALQ